MPSVLCPLASIYIKYKTRMCVLYILVIQLHNTVICITVTSISIYIKQLKTCLYLYVFDTLNPSIRPYNLHHTLQWSDYKIHFHYSKYCTCADNLIQNNHAGMLSTEWIGKNNVLFVAVSFLFFLTCIRPSTKIIPPNGS